MGERLRALREAEGISLREFSRRSGVSVGHLSRLERDLQAPTTGMLETVAAALDVELLDLVLDPERSVRHAVIAATASLTDEQLEQVGKMVDRLANERPVRRVFWNEKDEPPKEKPGRTSRTRRKRRRRRE